MPRTLPHLLVGLALIAGGSAEGQTPVGERVAAIVEAEQTIDVSGTVRDSATGAPVPATTVQALRNGRPVAEALADSSGHYVLHLPSRAAYVLTARRIGYRTTHILFAVPAAGAARPPDFRLTALATTLDTVVVATPARVAVDVRTGDQSYHQHTAAPAPTTTTSEIVQQTVAGAARAPTSEVHIRGQHAEFTYYLDGVPVPSGISGSLNELFDPAVADRIDFQTGGWDAEYGNKNIAVIKVSTRIPDVGPHVQVSGYGGSFASSGQSLMATTHAGCVDMLLSATHEATDMRREPLMQDPRTGAPLNFHNGGTDDFVFAKARFTPSGETELTVEANASRTAFQVPFDSTGGVRQDDRQEDVNAFVNVGFRRRFASLQTSDAVSSKRPDQTAGELFIATFARHGSLTYTPGASDQPSFFFHPDTTVRYAVSEDRAATTVGLKVDYTRPLGSRWTLKTGLETAVVAGREHFETRDSLKRPGPGVNSAVHGGDIGLYLQSAVAPSPEWELRTGIRVDHHIAPLAGDVHQVSPRVRLSFFPNAATSVWVYYGRLFIPSNVEDFHVLAAAGQRGAGGLPTIPERDHYFEAGAVRRFGPAVIVKLAGYYRNDAPAVDDNTLPGTALTTTVNIARVHVAGVESVVEFHPAGSVSGYLNVALSHASAHGPITGGFLPTAYPSGWFDQDHDQRLSIVASGEYTVRQGYLRATAVFGSGLTNGHPEAASNGTGLFDFNGPVKVAPSCILNAGAGMQLGLGDATLRPEVFVNNVFNLQYVLKGAFTSGPSIGRPRSVELRVTATR